MLGEPQCHPASLQVPVLRDILSPLWGVQLAPRRGTDKVRGQETRGQRCFGLCTIVSLGRQYDADCCWFITRAFQVCPMHTRPTTPPPTRPRPTPPPVVTIPLMNTDKVEQVPTSFQTRCLGRPWGGHGAAVGPPWGCLGRPWGGRGGIRVLYAWLAWLRPLAGLGRAGLWLDSVQLLAARKNSFVRPDPDRRAVAVFASSTSVN